MNNRTPRLPSALLLAIVAVTGCSSVVSSLPTMTTVNGDAWYTHQEDVQEQDLLLPAPELGPGDLHRGQIRRVQVRPGASL
jgi:hypothetical protein